LDKIDSWPQARWIYTEVIAGLSILLGLIWLIPFSSGFFSWPSTCLSHGTYKFSCILTQALVDILISFAWFAAFGILVDAIHHSSCGSIWSWRFGGEGFCGRWKAAEAFSFLSAIVWLVSALVVCII
jgi:hypothetical protein